MPNEWLYEAWDKIYAEFIEYVGLNEHYLKGVELERKYLSQMYEFRVNGRKEMRTMARLTALDIEEHKSKSPDVSFETVLAKVSKMQGYQIKPKEITVKEYYSISRG